MRSNTRSDNPVTRIADFCFVFGLLFGVGSYVLLLGFPELPSANPDEIIRSSVQYNGTIDIKRGGGQSKGIALYGDNNTRLVACYVGHCGYPTWRDDVGRKATFWVRDGTVVMIAVDGETRFSVPDFVDMNRRARTKHRFVMILAMACVLVSIPFVIRGLRQ